MSVRSKYLARVSMENAFMLAILHHGH